MAADVLFLAEAHAHVGIDPDHRSGSYRREPLPRQPLRAIYRIAVSL